MEYETTLVLILFGTFLGLLLLGAPITVALGVSALTTFRHSLAVAKEANLRGPPSDGCVQTACRRPRTRVS